MLWLQQTMTETINLSFYTCIAALQCGTQEHKCPQRLLLMTACSCNNSSSIWPVCCFPPAHQFCEYIHIIVVLKWILKQSSRRLICHSWVTANKTRQFPQYAFCIMCYIFCTLFGCSSLSILAVRAHLQHMIFFSFFSLWNACLYSNCRESLDQIQEVKENLRCSCVKNYSTISNWWVIYFESWMFHSLQSVFIFVIIIFMIFFQI